MLSIRIEEVSVTLVVAFDLVTDAPGKGELPRCKRAGVAEERAGVAGIRDRRSWNEPISAYIYKEIET